MSDLTPDVHPGPGPDVFEHGALNIEDILAFDRMAAKAWPAPYLTDLDGWHLRYGEGVSRRANSVAPFPSTSGGHSLIDQIEAAERFYKDRGLPPRFQVSPAAAPDVLDDELSERGYEIEAPVTLMIADVHDVARLSAGSENSMSEVLVAAPDGWWDLYIEGFDRDARKVISGAKDHPRFALTKDETGAGVGIGLGVLNNAGWLGIFGMWTRPELRGRGLGTDMLHALASSAIDNDAVGLYLQVERTNAKAHRLYQRIGFRALYAYHYRTLWP